MAYPKHGEYYDDVEGEIDIEGCEDDFDDDDDDEYNTLCSGASGINRIRRISGDSNSSCGGDQSEESKRDHHNQLERKRRASIKNSFNALKEVIPEIKGSKASRAVILQKAVDYIDDLKNRNKAHSRCVETLRRQNDSLEREVDAMDSQIRFQDNNSTSVYSSGVVSRAGSHSNSESVNLEDATVRSGGSSGSSPDVESDSLRPVSKRIRLQ